MTFNRILRDERGSIALEAAFTLPVMIMLMVAVLEFARVLQAGGALRHAVGEGIRYAKVHPPENPENSDSVSANRTEIENYVRDRLAGIDPAGIRSIEYESGISGGARYGRVTIEYETSPFVPFLEISAVDLRETRLAYFPS